MTGSNAPAAVLARLSCGVYVIGVAHGGRANAFTAAWLMQISFEPLLVALSVNTEHASYPLLTESGAFAVSVLARGQTELARRFGTRSGRDEDKLRGLPWRPGATGAPILPGVAAYLECRLSGSCEAGDHALVVARVVGGEVVDPSVVPMAYAETGDMDGSAALYPPAFPD